MITWLDHYVIVKGERFGDFLVTKVLINGNGAAILEKIMSASSLTAARSKVPEGLNPMKKTPFTDPKIVEVWV